MVGGREMLKGTKGGGLPVFGPDPDMGTRRCYWRLGLYRLDMVLCYQMVDSDLDYEQGGLGEIRCGQLGVSPPPERRRRMLYCWWHTGWREDGGTASIEPRASSLDTLI